ncbi:MAG: hypothetical protein B7X48_09950 [Acidiphilium sp. 34-60-192]|nr:MAG: hypothetical protein B7X48_09950 [Acidiphilium sp. 34-60-192]
MNISTDMLQAFAKTAETLSITAAAVELGVAKGVVSKRIKHLEIVLQVPLFTRTTRCLALTPAGDLYLGHARAALEALINADEGLRSLRSDVTGLIRVTASMSWGQRVLARLLPDFIAANPGVEIELLLDDRMMDLAQERIDLAFRMTARPSLDLVSIPVSRLSWAICASPAYLANAPSPRRPSDLAAHPCMAYWRVMQNANWHLERSGRRMSVRVRSRFRANNPEATCDAALAGLGIALLPGFVCDAAITDGRLVRLLEGWTPVTEFGTAITATALPDRVRLPRNKALLSFLRMRLAEDVRPTGHRSSV